MNKDNPTIPPVELTSIQLSKTPQVNATYKEHVREQRKERKMIKNTTHNTHKHIIMIYRTTCTAERERTVEFKKHRPTPQ